VKILCLDTTTARFGVSVSRGEKLLYEDISSPRQASHAQYLPQCLKGAITEAGFSSVQDLDAVGVVVGPGSFTGLRIGLSVAKGLAFAQNIPLLAIDGLEALAMSVSKSFDYIVPLIDAKKSQVYTTIYKVNHKGNTRLTEPVSVLPEDVPFPENGEICCIGDGALLYQAIFSRILQHRGHFLPESENYISPAIMAKIAFQKFQEGDLKTADSLTAMYIRRSDAEIRRDCKRVFE